MGRHLLHTNSDVQFQDYHHGCMWGIFHILDYHYWHNVKRMLPHKKQRRGGKHARCYGKPTTSMDRDTGEEQELLDVEADHFLVEQQTTKTSPMNKSSGKTCINKEMSKGENLKHWILDFPPRSQLQQSHSINGLEPSKYSLGEISTDWTKPIILLHNNADSATRLQVSSLPKAPGELVSSNKNCDLHDAVNIEGFLGHNHSALFTEKFNKAMNASIHQKPLDSKQCNREALHHQFKEHVDVLELFKVNKELFLKILQDPDVSIAKHFPGQQSSKREVKLTKSGSFPVADPSKFKYLRPTTLEHKQSENWSFPKVEKLLTGTQVPKVDASKSRKDYHGKIMPLMIDDSVGSAIKQETSFSPHGSFWGLNRQGWNQLIINRFKAIKRKIKHALKESNHTLSIDGTKTSERLEKKTMGQDGADDSRSCHDTDGGCTLSTDRTKTSERLEKKIMGQDGADDSRSCHDADNDDHDLSNGRCHSMRRTTSLNESFDKYARLLDSSFIGEAKWHHSRSLKLTNEDKISSRGRSPKFFGRISSLSDLESFCSFLNEVSRDALCSEIPSSTVVNYKTNTEGDGHSEPNSISVPLDTNKCEPIDDVVDTEFQRKMVEGIDRSLCAEYSAGLMVDRNAGGTSKIGDFSKDIVEPAMGGSSPHQEQDIGCVMNSSEPSGVLTPSSSVSVIETSFPDDMTNPAELPNSEGSELNPMCLGMDEPDSSIEFQGRSGTDSLLVFCSTVNHENVEYTNKVVDNHSLQLDTENDACFSYVRDVLELAGFIGNECLGTWPSIDQPLNPLLFKELEACLHPEIDFSGEVGGNCDHQLLFDLINEALLEIYERSFTYFPRDFSFGSGICPILPMGYRVLEEVWKRISWYLSSRLELDQSLDDIVTRDLSKGDGWMNLKLESECVALELEDMIFDELLEEVICSS